MELPKIKKSEHGMSRNQIEITAHANPHYDDGYYDEGSTTTARSSGEYGPDYNEDDFPPTMLPVRVMSPMRP